jgi:hypothetical protein
VVNVAGGADYAHLCSNIKTESKVSDFGEKSGDFALH